MFAHRQAETVPVILFLASLFLGSFTPYCGLAQELVVCKTQQDGIPRGSSMEWKVDSFPVQLTLFYNHGKTTIDERNLNFIIEPEQGLGIAPSEISIVVSQGRNWASIPFMFQRSGKYAISAYRSNKSILASTHISVTGPEKQFGANAATGTAVGMGRRAVDGEQPPAVQVPPTERVPVKRPLTEEEKKTLHFEGVRIAFGTGIKNHKLEGGSSSFGSEVARKGIQVQLTNPKPFGAKALLYDVWRSASSGSDADHSELIVNGEMSTDPKAYTVSAPLTLFKTGSYKVSFFTAENVWIGSAYLTVE